MKSIEEIKPAFRVCEQCGTCTAACHFSDSGLLNIRRLVRRVCLDLCDDAFLSLEPWKCSSCGRCSRLCVEGLDIPALIHALREMARGRGLEPAAAAAVAEAVRKGGSPFRSAGRRRDSWIDARCAPEAGAATLYWAGCASAFMLPSVARASASVVKAVCGSYNSIPDEPCCGEPLLALGRLDDARRAAEKAAEAVRASGARTVAVSCSGCFATFRRYKELFGIEIGAEVRHVSQLLAERPVLSALPEGLRLAYHDPCSLGRGCGVYEEPRTALRSIGGVDLAELDPGRELSACCGGGGGVWAVDNEAAQAAASARIAKSLLPLAVDGLVTCCPVCHLNFRAALRKAKSKIRVFDLSEIAAAALANKGPGAG